jgi:hypothetical protein
MSAWLNAHKVFFIGSLLVVMLLLYSGDEILWIIRDGEGNKGRRAAKKVFRAFAFVLGGSGFMFLLVTPLLVWQRWGIRWAYLTALLVTFIALGGPAYAVMTVIARDPYDRREVQKRLYGALVRVLFAPGLLLCLYLLYSFIQWVRQMTK